MLRLWWEMFRVLAPAGVAVVLVGDAIGLHPQLQTVLLMILGTVVIGVYLVPFFRDYPDSQNR